MFLFFFFLYRAGQYQRECIDRRRSSGRTCTCEARRGRQQQPGLIYHPLRHSHPWEERAATPHRQCPLFRDERKQWRMGAQYTDGAVDKVWGVFILVWNEALFYDVISPQETLHRITFFLIFTIMKKFYFIFKRAIPTFDVILRSEHFLWRRIYKHWHYGSEIFKQLNEIILCIL